MALFDGAKRVEGSRSHSRLVVSEGFSPAERWITDPDLNPLFEHHYGGPGFVVIPKGTICSVGAAVYDYEVGREVNVLTIADDSSKTPVGVAPYNIYQRVTGRLYHNFPSIITRDYIEVPYFSDINDVYNDTTSGTTEPPVSLNSNTLKMRWGCAYGTLAVGDFVGSDKFGKFIKVDTPATNFDKIVGQVLAMELDMPPTGWLKWLDWATEQGERADDQNRLPYPTNPNTGRPWTPDYKWPLTPDYRGIPGMTDGAQMGNKTVTSETVSTKYTDDDSTDTHKIPAGSEAGQIVVFRLANAPVVKDTVKVYNTATTPAELDGNVHVDTDTGWVYYTVTSADAATTAATTPADLEVAISYEYHDLDYLGVPAAWDFKGSSGAVRILLKF